MPMRAVGGYWRRAATTKKIMVSQNVLRPCTDNNRELSNRIKNIALA
jgi:hypothetical protein